MFGSPLKTSNPGVSDQECQSIAGFFDSVYRKLGDPKRSAKKTKYDLSKTCLSHVFNNYLEPCEFFGIQAQVALDSVPENWSWLETPGKPILFWRTELLGTIGPDSFKKRLGELKKYANPARTIPMTNHLLHVIGVLEKLSEAGYDVRVLLDSKTAVLPKEVISSAPAQTGEVLVAGLSIKTKSSLLGTSSPDDVQASSVRTTKKDVKKTEAELQRWPIADGFMQQLPNGAFQFKAPHHAGQFVDESPVDASGGGNPVGDRGQHQGADGGQNAVDEAKNEKASRTGFLEGISKGVRSAAKGVSAFRNNRTNTASTPNSRTEHEASSPPAALAAGGVLNDDQWELVEDGGLWKYQPKKPKPQTTPTQSDKTGEPGFSRISENQ